MTTKVPDEVMKVFDHFDAYIMGECNCHNCRDGRTEKHLNDSILIAYPTLGFIPRKYNRWNNYSGNHDIRGVRRADQPLYIFKRIVALREKNNTLRRSLIKAGSKSEQRTFCVECGTINLKATCGKVSVKVGKELEASERWVCKKCLNRLYTKCPDCDKWHRQGSLSAIFSDMNYYNDYMDGEEVGDKCWRYVCRGCLKKYQHCQNCGIRLESRHMTDVSEISRRARVDIYYCPRCVEERVETCPECGDKFLSHEGKSVMIADPDEDGGGRVTRVCVTCYNDRVAIKSHDYRPAKFHKLVSQHEGKVVPEDKLLYGFEIEVENMGIYDEHRDRHRVLYDRESLARKIQDYCNDKFSKEFGYIVHDGTLKAGNDIGIEIVTHPVSWMKYKEDKNKYTDLLRQLRIWGCQAYRPGTAGFHSHMSKTAFTRLHLYKFVDFLYKRSVADFRTAIAQRKSNRYAAYDSLDATNTKKTAKDKYNPSGSHYAAVNLTNPDTVEVRIFRGVLEPLHFHKNIEFLHSLYRFTRDNRLQDMVVYNYIKYVLENKNEYRCLIDFIKQSTAINKRYTSIAKLMKGI